MGDAVVTVEVAFTAGILDTAPVWTDISDRVFGCSGSRGRSFELDTTQAGEFSAVLDSFDGAFDPANPDSVHAPDVRPMRRVRVTVTADSVDYPIFDGYVQRWPTQYQGALAQTELIAVDAFALFERHELGSAWETDLRRITDADLVAWWRFGTGSTQSTLIDSSGNGHDAEAVVEIQEHEPPTLGEPGAILNDDDGALRFGHNADDHNLGTEDFLAPTGISGTGGFTFVTFYQRDNGDPLYSGVKGLAAQIGLISGSEGYEWWLAIDTDGTLAWICAPNLSTPDGFSQTSVSTGSVDLDDGEWHMIAAARRSNGAPRLWVDGTLVLDGSAVTATSLNPRGIEINTVGAWFALDESILVDRELTTAEILELWTTSQEAWGGETAGTRIERLLDEFEWPVSRRDIDPGISELSPADTKGKTLLAALQDLATADNGLLFIDGSGNVVFHDRHHRLVPPNNTSLATFGDDGTELEYADFQTDDDEMHIINDITVEGDGGVGRATDSTSITDYGRRKFTRTLPLQDLADVQSLAEWLIDHYAHPRPRLTSLRVEPVLDDDLWEQALGRELGDRLTVKRRLPPDGTVPYFDEDVHVEKVTYDFSDKPWRVTWSTSPAEQWSYWILGDATYGVLGSTTRLAY